MVYWCVFSPSKRSPARTASLPPRPSRPLVLRRELAQPAQEAAETYSVAGVNYTTYTTFRSPITPDQCDSVSSKQFPSEGEGGGETSRTCARVASRSVATSRADQARPQGGGAAHATSDAAAGSPSSPPPLSSLNMLI